MSWQIDLVDGVAVVTMNTNAVNAQNDEFFIDLHEALDRLEQNDSAAGLVLTGHGTVFSAGIDLKRALPLFATGDLTAIREWFARYRATNIRLFSYPRPVVAAINGHAFAGGVITALCCDYRIAGDRPLRMSLNEVPIGIPMPAVYSEIIRYAIGGFNTTQAVLFGTEYDANAARQIGFVHEVVDHEKLLEVAVKRAKLISADSMAAYASAKRGLQAATLSNIAAVEPLDHAWIAAVADPRSLRAHKHKHLQLTGKDLSRNQQSL